MLINLKSPFINYLITILFIFVLTIIQNNLWPAIVNNQISVYLWIPVVIYWGLYRKTQQTIFIIYFITLSVASTSTLFFGYILAFNCLLLLTIYLFKKVYYKTWKFFSIACALALFLFPFVLWILSKLINRPVYFSEFIPWLEGILVTWIFSLFVFSFFQYLDHLTLTSHQNYNAQRWHV